MDLFTIAKERGIQTEFFDGQGHRHVTGADALKIILDALPAATPHRLVGEAVVVRIGRPSRTELGQAATLPVHWKIVADPGVIAEGDVNDRVIVWRYRWNLGEPTPMHFHDKDVVVVYLEDSALKSTEPDGKSILNEYKAGDIRFNRRDRTHTELLVRDTASAVITELK